MKKRFYNLLLIVVPIILFGGILKIANAQLPPTTLIEYPAISSQSVAFGMSLPNLIKYIYLFAVGICGAIALASILFGAIKYIGAAGNSSRISDAKEQIVSAILGVVILLSSYLILYTINPDLVTLGFSLPKIDTSKFNSGTDDYMCTCRCWYNSNSERGTITMHYDIVLDPSKIPANTSWNEWGSQICMRDSSYTAWQNCKETCENTDDHQGLGTGCSKSNVSNAPDLHYENSSIKSCTIKPNQ